MIMVKIYILFWLYSFLGFIMETLVVSIYSKKIVNRGFLLGPYCPIYGTGAIFLLCLDDFKNHQLVVFILSIVICTIIEYITSYVLEKIFKVRWWDYSNKSFNLNGRVCLLNSICFGFLGLFLVCYMNPYFFNLLNGINQKVLIIIALIIFIITLIDIVITFSIMFDIRKTIVNFKDNTLTNIFKKNQDNTEEINKKIRTILNEKSFLHHHLIKTYNNLKIYKNNITKTSIIIKKRYQDKIETKFVVSIFLSIFIGYLIGKLVNKIGLVISICFAINIIIIKLMDKKDE